MKCGELPIPTEPIKSIMNSAAHSIIYLDYAGSIRKTFLENALNKIIGSLFAFTLLTVVMKCSHFSIKYDDNFCRDD